VVPVEIERHEFNCSLAYAMKVARERDGLSLSDAAAQIGVSISQLSRFENGTRFFSAAQIKDLAGVLIRALDQREREETRVRKSAEFELSVPELATKFASMSGQTVAVTVGSMKD